MSNNRAHLIQLEANEDATSVRDRLSFHRGERVLLVWPEKGKVLSRKLDLVLIQREAMRRAVRLALVTHDAEVVKNATELNISTFETIGESERKRWKRGRSKVFTNRYQKPEPTPQPEELQDVASRVKNPQEAHPLRRTLIRAGVALALVGAVLGVAYVVVPAATVTLTPAYNDVEITVSISAAPNADDINVEQGVIPMTVLRVETVQTGEVATTGIQELESTRAAGTVVFINRGQNAVEIPAGTVVQTTAGAPVQFRTVAEADLPAGVGLQVEVGVEALQDYAGEIGNVSEGQINAVAGQLEGQVDVRNVRPTTGGTRSTAAAVTPDDQTRLESMVRQQIQSQAYTEMLPLLNDSQFIILQSVRIAEERNDWKTYNASVGDVAETLSLDMRAIVEAVAVDEQFGRQIAFAALSTEIPRGRELQPQSVQYTRSEALRTGDDGTVTFDITARATVVEPVDVAAVQRQIAGKPLNQAFETLASQIDVQQGTAPTIRLSPAWLRQMPILPLRIRIQLEGVPS